MEATTATDEAFNRMKSMLDYVEQLIKLDEKVAYNLSQHRLADGSQFILHQHELAGVPGLRLDQVDEEGGPIWLRMERLVRSRPPEPPAEINEWLSISNDPNQTCHAIDVLRKRVALAEKERLLTDGLAFADECQPSLKDEPNANGEPQHFDLSLSLNRRPTLRNAIDIYLADQWAAWAEVERPIRKSIGIYQRLFEIAQLLAAGNADQAELVCGIGLSKWRKESAELHIPIIIRTIEIQILENELAEIVIRPRQTPAQVELRAFQVLSAGQFNLTEEAARRSTRSIEASEPEGISPFRRESFEPILKLCSSQLDPEGRYLPEHIELEASSPLPNSEGDTLNVSDRFVIFARRRTMNVVVSDVERLRQSLTSEEVSRDDLVEGAARTLVLGPRDGLDSSYKPLGSIGSIGGDHIPDEPEKDADHGDLFFPKPFNEEQVAIVRRLENSDGVVVQGPPGTGKTHTIANVISHMLATGKRVLVVSHGETALSVVRDQLPEQIRDLAISVTTSDRDGERQVEAAVSLMLRIVNDFTMDHQAPRRRIARLDAQIIQDRNRLKEIDRDLDSIAKAHLSTVPGSSMTPFDLAKKLMAERLHYSWFVDRPKKILSETSVDVQLVDRALSARRVLASDLQYLDIDLPDAISLPDSQTLEVWRTDLLRSKEIAAAASHTTLTRRLMGKLAATGLSTLLEEVEAVLRDWQQVAKENWTEAVFKLSANQDPQFTVVQNQFEWLVQKGTQLGKRYQDFLVRSVSLPNVLPPSDELQDIIGQLANGKNPFGLLGFKLRKHQQSIDEIKIQALRPTTPDDWRHVARFIALRSDFENFAQQWNNLFTSLDIAQNTHVGLQGAAASSALLANALNLPQTLSVISKKLDELSDDHAEIAGITHDRQQLERFAHAIAARLSQTRLAAVQRHIDETKRIIPTNDAPVNSSLRIVLENIDSSEASASQLPQLWENALTKLNDLKKQRASFAEIIEASNQLSAEGATALATLIKQPFDGAEDPIKQNWQAAWGWWAWYSYLDNIGAREQLSELYKSRIDTEKRLRSSFAELVRERAFYALAGSMRGQAKAALKAFSDLVRKLGRGTGRKAVLHRRELRSAMEKCFDAVPCWIMPAWRVSEQLPSQMGSFDLVILDEASQSDAKELPAVLRGKKVLIVGDDRQVSPTDAFIKQDDIERLRMNYLQDLPFPSHLLPGSSIYDLARVMFPDKFVMLKEHFRCVEPIIHFSTQFYNEPLVPLRIPTVHERLDPPLVDIFVEDGRRHETRKINEREAEVIVNEIARIVEDPDLSRIHGPSERPRTIGVISLIGSEQARLIQQQLIGRLGEPKFIEHRVICGDSATMQGNERDIVFLSMIADGHGRIGAQTAEQFRRRFNVALSRARDRMVLVRSIEEDRLNPNDLKAKVIRHFQAPMPAAAVTDGELIEQCQSEFEKEIFTRLLAKGYRVRPQVGSLGYSIDLVVEGANGRRLAIECDGDLYHGPERWADDMRRQRILERVGWIFWRVFASTYALDPDEVFQDLLQTLDRLGITPGEMKASHNKWTEHRTVTSKETPAPESDLTTNGATKPRPPTQALIVGDRIVLQFIDKPDTRPKTYEITESSSDANAGYLNIQSPLAKHLRDLDIGEEFSLEVEGSEQRILFVAKQSAATPI